jgi:hypothetical protein
MTIPFFMSVLFVVGIRNVVWQNTYYNAKQYWEGDDRYDQLKFFNKVLTNQFVI